MNENGCKGILEMGSYSEVQELEEDRNKKLLCLWLNIRNYKYKYIICQAQLRGKTFICFKYYLHGRRDDHIMIDINLVSQKYTQEKNSNLSLPPLFFRAEAFSHLKSSDNIEKHFCVHPESGLGLLST